MSWNYRVLKHKDLTYGIHEVYYDTKGLPTSWTANPVTVTSHLDLNEIQFELEGMLQALEKPVLLEDSYEKDGYLREGF